MIGIISGTYSSIFNAASILVDWEIWLARRRGAAPTGPVADLEAPPAPNNGGARVASDGGGSARPLPARPAAPVAAARESSVTATALGDAADGVSRLRPKKKRPSRRF